MALAVDGHPVLDALITRYRAKQWNSFRLDHEQLLVLQLWEIAARTVTEAEALDFTNELYSLAIDHYLAFNPAPAHWWNLAARSRNRRLRHHVECRLSAAGHASRYYSFVAHHGPKMSTEQTEIPTRKGTP